MGYGIKLENTNDEIRSLMTGTLIFVDKTNWVSSNGKYTNTVNVKGLTSSSEIIMAIRYDKDERTDVQDEAYALINGGTTDTNKIILEASAIPSVSLYVVLKGNIGVANEEIGNFEDVTDKLDDIEVDLDVQTSRIDDLIRLEDGSTTGDAELQDARRGYNNTSYGSLGTAIRSQISDLHDSVDDMVRVDPDEEEVTVPTITAFNSLKDNVTDLKEDISTIESNMRNIVVNVDQRIVGTDSDLNHDCWIDTGNVFNATRYITDLTVTGRITDPQQINIKIFSYNLDNDTIVNSKTFNINLSSATKDTIISFKVFENDTFKVNKGCCLGITANPDGIVWVGYGITNKNMIYCNRYNAYQNNSITNKSTLQNYQMSFVYSCSEIGKIELDEDKFRNKLWYCFGTSITDERTGTGKYPPILAELSGMKYVNHGIGNARIYGDILTEIKSVNYENVDVVTVEGFVNDWFYGSPLGQLGDTDGSQSYYGAIYEGLKYILDHSNALVIGIGDHTGCKYGDTDITRAILKNGHKQIDFLKAFKETCEYMNVPFIWAGNISMISENTASLYMVDQIHHTDLGGKQFANAIWSEMKSLPLRALGN